MILTSADISVHKTYTNPHDPINSLSSIYCGLSASEISLPDFELCSIDTPLENFTPETPCLFLDSLSKLSDTLAGFYTTGSSKSGCLLARKI